VKSREQTKVKSRERTKVENRIRYVGIAAGPYPSSSSHTQGQLRRLITMVDATSRRL